MIRKVGPFTFEDTALDKDTRRFQSGGGPWVVARREESGIITLNKVDHTKATLDSDMKFIEGCCETCLRCATDGQRAVFYCADGTCRCHTDDEGEVPK